MRMKLSRKGLLVHTIKPEFDALSDRSTVQWTTDDLKALGVIAGDMSLTYQVYIRGATTTANSWRMLEEQFNRNTLKNRLIVTKKLHNFKMELGTRFAVHGDQFKKIVLQMETIGAMLAKCGADGMEIEQCDVDTTFLYGKLEEEICMKLPEGLRELPELAEAEGEDDVVCMLLQSLYELKQASRVWNETINTHHNNMRFEPADTDPCVYMRGEGEAEYMALSGCVKECVWMRHLLKGIGAEQVGATVIYEDNQGAMALAKNVGYQARTKHIDICYHFIRDKVVSNKVELEYVDTKNQLADFMTKGLSSKSLRNLMMRSNVAPKLETSN
ncbi:hypothetical protein PF005_g19561 [Phytophthora fragariae]|uniref:Reverse transcriptase Ty1/copia-type domain-containing protein n=1 Tax=Phytophthora fragariae TaxID=53985 RepID=A0A6A3WRM1_9STRA|nr:hypothetical protein PF003_g36835 [Phytophthora fragariae]KAE8940606.1 hypothetical protein PF009_g9585 [Phytophthora fragariae]KAE9005381.1 hypothetical protein PF011_g12070 [Phytophthora fragariae]KAE9112460.1 hypothetical protein PF007_g11095 [Phytophthora fragariae]KAE9143886.1 hypothetical protein PF006_g11123 [Phytophthora fragariae]